MCSGDWCQVAKCAAVIGVQWQNLEEMTEVHAYSINNTELIRNA
jgi:hypothetical protein